MIEHLIFSTLAAVVGVAAVFVLRSRATAALRHAILLVAILQFAVPATWWMSAGGRMARLAPRPVVALPLVGLLHPGILQVTIPPAKRTLLVEMILAFVWAVGAMVCLGGFVRRLSRRVERVRAATEVESRMCGEVAVVVAHADCAPGVRGTFQPVLILPEGLSTELSEAELAAIVAHELAHVRRRDNLTAALTHVVVSVFWFHPLVWWMERRMLTERETACDEMVLESGTLAEDYAAGIAKVCQMAFAGGAAYVGITGANLKERMEHIMSTNFARSSSRAWRAVPMAVVAVAVMVPLATGFLEAQEAVTVTTAVDVLANAGAGFWKAGNYSQAEETFQRMRREAPGDIRGVVGLAETYWSEGRQEDAIQLMQTEAERHPARIDYQLPLANFLVRATRYDSAIAIFQSVVQDDPSSGNLFRMAETYRRMGDLTRAMETFQRAIVADPKNAEALLQVALILDRTGRRADAVPVYERVLRLQPNNTVALNNLAFAKAEDGNDLDSALAMAQAAYKKVPDSEDIADTLGWIYIKKNLGGDAVALYQDVTTKHPENAAFHYHFGMALLQTGDKSGALRELSDALRNKPSKDEQSKIEALLMRVGQ
jgi:beta-lactamase regulating signal transducer with metallopeptidase domain/tetratricopeptide (TPR) repeat protein